MARDRFNEFQNAAQQRPMTYARPNNHEMANMGGQYGGQGGQYGGPQQGGPPPPYGNQFGGQGPPPPGGQGGNMGYQGGYQQESNPSTEFFEKLGQAQDVVNEISSTLAQIDHHHRLALSAMTDTQTKSAQSQLDTLIDSTTRHSHRARTLIKNLNTLMPSIDPSERDIARNQLQAIKQKFMNTMTEFQNIETTYRNKNKERLERQFRIVKPDASREEIEDVVQREGGTQMFAQSVLRSNPYGQAREALREVQERHDDIRKIEKTILELHQLFQDMAMMVEAQAEQVQQVTQHVEQTEQNADAAHKEIGEAITIRKRTRKKLWCLCFLGLVLIAIIIVVIYIYVIAPSQEAVGAVTGGDSSGESNNNNNDNNSDNNNDNNDSGNSGS